MNDDEQWRDKLSAEEYRVCREKGTEPPFSGEYYHNHDSGKYLCKCCGEILFDSEYKYDSGSGWPSFDRPANDDQPDPESYLSVESKRTSPQHLHRYLPESLLW